MLGTQKEQKNYPVFWAVGVIAFVILAILVLQLATSVSNLIIANRANSGVMIQSGFQVAPQWQAVRDQYEITYPRAALSFVVAPEWQAVRDQYDVSAAGFTPYIAPPAWAFAQAQYAASVSGFAQPLAMAPTTFVVAPEWQAVRDQYEISYARTTSTFVVAPEWQAVRDQYEITYAPVIHSLPTFVVAPEWIALRQQYEGGYGYTSPEVRRP
jgi:hypothetical protein